MNTKEEMFVYQCSNCGYESSKYFGLCPNCKDGVGEKVEVQKTQQQAPSGMFNPRENKKFEGKLDIRKVDKNAKQMQTKFKTQFNDLNEVLSSVGGFVDSDVVILGALPGSGKSTLTSQLSNKNTLYISSEESYEQVNNRILRVNPDSECEILSTTSIDCVLEAIKTTPKEFIIIDSINSIEFGVGYMTTARYANDITKLIKDLHKVCIIISQVTKGGEITGSQALLHVVDTILYMEKSEANNAVIVSSTKNRFGEIGQVAAFRHTEKGLVEISIDQDSIKPEIGITYSKSRFGHKNLTISVESLVTNAQASYGIKKSNGFNFNVLTQITGILSYYAKLDFNFKDVYINIGEGLYCDDINIQLAVANSILSSLHGKAVAEFAQGSIKLNGKVNDGYVLSHGRRINIHHIKDLLDLYRG